MKKPVRILDLILVFFLFSQPIFGAGPKSGPYPAEINQGYRTESYNESTFFSTSINPTATASFKMGHTSRIYLYLDQAASVSFHFSQADLTSSTVVLAAATWESYPASFSFTPLSYEMATDTHIWIHNGPATQTVRIKGIGRKNNK